MDGLCFSTLVRTGKGALRWGLEAERTFCVSARWLGLERGREAAPGGIVESPEAMDFSTFTGSSLF